MKNLIILSLFLALPALSRAQQRIQGAILASVGLRSPITAAYGPVNLWVASETTPATTNDSLTLQYLYDLRSTNWADVVTIDYWGEEVVITVLSDGLDAGFWRWKLHPFKCPFTDGDP